MDAVSEIFRELDKAPSVAAYAVAARRLAVVARSLPPFRVAILANHTFDIGAPLTVECARRGLGAVVYEAGYDQYRQSLLDPQSGLDRFEPDAVLISLHLDQTVQDLSAVAGEATPLPSAAERWLEEFAAHVAVYRRRSVTPVFVQDFIPPVSGMDGLLGARGGSTFDAVMALNRRLRQLASAFPAVFVVSAAELACRSDLASWHDARLWYLAKVGISPRRLPMLAAHVARHLAALRRPAAKCLVLDLDNTLWGGILGEVGPEGLLCGAGDYPANAYSDFQRAVLGLRSRGILLAVASKNDLPAVEEAFEARRDMPLRPEHVAAWQVHWGPKPESLQRIAASLNISTDSLVLLDDNPDEIALVKMALPEVRAHLMPSAPERFVEFLGGLEEFDQLEVTVEDRRRADLYEARKKQDAMTVAATDLEAFYRALGTVLAPEPADDGNFDRIVQLIRKTNQFNLTTRRHDAGALRQRLARGSELWAFRASDIHADHGIIAVALLDFAAAACTIDTLLMSCRVIGRTLETAILHFLEGRALVRGAMTMRAEHFVTPKNGPCRDFCAQHGFQRASGDERGTEWVKEVERTRTVCPEWITIRGAVGDVCAKI